MGDQGKHLRRVKRRERTAAPARPSPAGLLSTQYIDLHKARRTASISLAQDAWLRLFGTDLATAFGIEGATLLVATARSGRSSDGTSQVTPLDRQEVDLTAAPNGPSVPAQATATREGMMFVRLTSYNFDPSKAEEGDRRNEKIAAVVKKMPGMLHSYTARNDQGEAL